MRTYATLEGGPFDVVITGSGSAGSPAAIAVARNGAKTLLLERYGRLGGTSTAVLDTFYGFYTPGSVSAWVVGGIPDDVVEALRKGAAHNAHASVRSMAQCMAMGRAADTAAAAAVGGRKRPREPKVAHLQDDLQHQGAVLSME